MWRKRGGVYACSHFERHFLNLMLRSYLPYSLAESSDLHCLHSAAFVLAAAEFDEVATGERPPACCRWPPVFADECQVAVGPYVVSRDLSVGEGHNIERESCPGSRKRSARPPTRG
jgi:hypothetical protein